MEPAYYRTSEGEEAMLGRHSKTARNIRDRVSGAKARVHQKKKKSRKENPIYKGAQRRWEGEAWMMLTALLKEAEMSNKP